MSLWSVVVVRGPDLERGGFWSGVVSFDAGTGGSVGQNWGCARLSKMVSCISEDCAVLGETKLEDWLG